jgi:hypothetical protein
MLHGGLSPVTFDEMKKTRMNLSNLYARAPGKLPAMFINSSQSPSC